MLRLEAEPAAPCLPVRLQVLSREAMKNVALPRMVPGAVCVPLGSLGWGWLCIRTGIFWGLQCEAEISRRDLGSCATYCGRREASGGSGA